MACVEGTTLLAKLWQAPSTSSAMVSYSLFYHTHTKIIYFQHKRQKKDQFYLNVIFVVFFFFLLCFFCKESKSRERVVH